MDITESDSDRTRKQYGRFFWIFVLVHFAAWVVLPLLTRPNYPLDVVECFFYGQELVFASGKHPPLPSWVTYGISSLSNRSEAAPYIASQIFVFFAFFSIWRLGSEMLSPTKALLATCAMELYSYFSIYSLEFNNSISLIGCWSLATLCFYYAIQRGKLPYWLLCGLFLGLGTLAKYSSFMLVIIMLGIMFLEPKARKYWKTPGPYLTTLIALVIFMPHLYTVMSAKFSTVGYVMARTSGHDLSLSEHFIFPARFALTQLGIIAPILMFFLIFAKGKFRLRTRDQGESFNTRMLLFLVAFPFALQMLASMILGVMFSTIYGSHIWIFLGIFLAYFLDIDERSFSPKKIGIFAGIAMVMMLSLTASRDIGAPYLRDKPSRIHYPGKEIARTVEDVWASYSKEPCRYITGEWWLAGMVAAYGNEQPTVFCGISPDNFDSEMTLSTWGDLSEVKEVGGICIWDVKHYQAGVPPTLREEFPDAIILESHKIPYSTGADIPPLELGIAIIVGNRESGVGIAKL